MECRYAQNKSSLKKVVYNKKNHTIGVLTGRFKVNLKKGSKIEDLEKKLNLKTLIKSSEDNFYYLKSLNKAVDSTKELIKIKSDPSVLKASFEIIENFNSLK